MESTWRLATLIGILLLLIAVYFLGNGSYDMIFSKSELSKPILTQAKTSSRPCTFALFREAYRNEGYFPSGGKWQVTNNVSHYQPEICKFRFPRVEKDFILKCLSKANISYLLTMGDSTGGRYSSGLVKTSKLSFRRTRAEKLKEKGFLPDKDYFTKQIPADVAKFVKAKFRSCKGCACNKNRATFIYKNRSYSVDIEHVAQTRILDDSLEVVFPSPKAANGVLNKVRAITMPELIFRYYLKNRYPDVFLIFLPFSHAKVNIAMSRLPKEITYFKELVEEFFPNITKFVYMPVYAEYERERKSKTWKNRLFENMLATEKLDKMNHVLFDVLQKDLLEPNGRYFSFLDLLEVSKDRGAWSTDGVHMKPVWYESVMSMFWETYCNSVLRDEF